MGTSILLVIFLVGSSAPQNADDFLLLTIEAIAEGQNRIVQKLEDLQTQMTGIQESQKTVEENVGDLQTQMTGIQESQKTVEENLGDLQADISMLKVQVENVQTCSTRDQVEAFKNTFVTELEAVSRPFQQCSTRDQIITFQDLLETDECEEGSHNCSSSAICSDSLLHYQCYCMAGYSGDGFTCEDVDECKEIINACVDEQICINYPGNYSCTCQEGFKKEGNTCQDVDECRETINACEDEQICINHVGSYSCNCSEGYKKEGNTCQDINECESGGHRCSSNASCINTISSYTCRCLPSVVGDGFTCSDCKSPSQVIPGLGCVTPVKESMTWDQAKEKCRSRGERLLEGIKTEHLQPIKRLHDYLKASYAMIGLRGGVWVTTRVRVSSLDVLWGTGYPNRSHRLKDDCGQINLANTPPYLIDYNCSDKVHVLCQRPY